jgi:hypothetical protein
MYYKFFKINILILFTKMILYKLLNDINIQLDGLEESLKKYNDKFNN